ncbi:MAG: type VI secretion system amidase effector protein Tae4 [Candidatus Thiosymbion ectosymbiont of Robbea hypermnestra]|nr:type VI secretion system amidase effector protein Tae4 [Candidatus Thiosymbion ectosymbiont of Robbea hypermnestra]
MKPAFKTLWNNYPHPRAWSRERLFREIGWDGLINEPGYNNTCAIRLSMALQKSGISISSSVGMAGLKGVMKAKPIEVRQEDLSNQLRRLWGPPRLLPKTKVENAIGDADGVISFFRIAGYQVGGGLGGHIDLVDGKSFATINLLYFWERRVDLSSVCGSACYWNAGEIWFWDLA